MKVFFNQSKNKRTSLINTLKATVDRRKRYKLTIFTCYLPNDVNDISIFLKEICEKIKIENVRVFVDSRQCIKSEINVLQDYQKEINSSYWDDWLMIFAVDTPSIFHTKAYVLESVIESSGVIALGSANFSKSGLFNDKKGNFESLIISNDYETVKDFLLLKDIKKHIMSLEELERFKKTDSLSFKYAMLQEGIFVRKWSGGLGQYFSVKYTLTDKGKQQISGGELSNLDFKIDADTISRLFVDFDSIDKGWVDSFSFSLRQGIETSLGHWVPRIFFPEIEDSNKLKNFFDLLSQNINEQLYDNSIKIESVYRTLIEKEFVEQEKSPKEIIAEKLNKLKKDQIKLKKLYYRYSYFDLPYDFSNTEEIEGIYNEIYNVCFKNRVTNQAMKRFIKAYNEKKPSLINLEE